MDNAARKIDEDGIDTEFESAIGKALEEVDEVASAVVRARNRPSSNDLRGVAVPQPPETPIDQAHRILNRAQDLCTRVETLCSALIGGSAEPAMDLEDRSGTKGLMGNLSRHGDETDVRIAFTNKRLEELERIMLGHSGGVAASAR